jgi:hypothetical protein
VRRFAIVYEHRLMKNRTHFAFRVDLWTDDGENIIEHLAGAEDFTVAFPTFRAACEGSPEAAFTFRQDARVTSADELVLLQARHTATSNADYHQRRTART